MTFIDFQIDAQRFLAAQRTYLRRLALCMPELPDVGGVRIVLDRVDVGPSSLRHDDPGEFDVFYVERGEVRGSPTPATGFLTKLTQQLTLQLTTDTLIRDHANGDPPLFPWQVTVVYDVSAFALDQECFLRAAPDSVKLGPPPGLPVALPPGLAAALEAFVSTQLRVLGPSGTVPMGLVSLKLPRGFLNAGISVDATGRTLAIRVQLTASQDPMWAAWTNFHRGSFEDRRSGRDWAVFVPAAYINYRITTELWAQIPRHDDLEAYPGAAYAVVDGRARFTVDVLLIYHLVEVDELDLDITVQAQPKVDVTLWVEARNQLSALVDYGGVINPVGALSSIVVALADAFVPAARHLLYRIIGAAVVDALADEADHVTQPTESTVRIDQRVPVPSISGVAMAAATDVLAHPDGIALAGSFQVSEPSNAAATVLGVRQLHLQVPRISCGAASMSLVALFGSDPGRFAILGAGASIGNLGSAPLRLCTPPALVPRGGPAPPLTITGDDVGLPIDVDVAGGLPSPDYYAAPFPFEILVRTNAGTRMIRLDPPPVVTQADLDRIRAELLVAIGNCTELVDPWFKHHRGYNPRWSPRPPGDLEVLHQWEVMVSGLPVGEAVALQGPDGVELARAVSTATDADVAVAVVVAPAAGREVGIVRIGADAPEAAAAPDEAGRGIEVRQTNLIVQGELPLAQPVHALGTTSIADRPVLVTLTADRAEAMAVSTRGTTEPVAEWEGEFTGMVAAPGGALLFGPAGVSRIDQAGVLSATGIDSPVLDAASSSAGLFLVTPDRVLHTTADLQPVAELARSDVTSVAVVGHDVLLGNAGGVETVDERLAAVPPGRLRAGRVSRSGAIRSLARESGLRRGAVLATLEDGRAALLATSGDHVAEVGTFTTTPLLAGAVRLGDTLVQVSPQSSERLRVLRVGPTVTL